MRYGSSALWESPTGTETRQGGLGDDVPFTKLTGSRLSSLGVAIASTFHRNVVARDIRQSILNANELQPDAWEAPWQHRDHWRAFKSST